MYDAKQLLNVLPSVWRTDATLAEHASAWLSAFSTANVNIRRDIQTVREAIGRASGIQTRNVPFARVVVPASSIQQLKYVYGGGLDYTGDVKYGEGGGDYSTRIPGLVAFTAITNTITNDRSRLVVNDVDCHLRGHTIVTSTSIVDLLGLEPYAVYDQLGNVTSTEYEFWLLDAEFVDNHLYDQFGVVLRAKPLRDMSVYAAFVNAGYSMRISDNTLGSLTACIAALIGQQIPTITEDVVDVVIAGDVRFVLTDKNTYRISDNGAMLGSTVVPGSLITDAVEIIELRRGSTPNVSGLTLSRGMLSAGFTGDLSFPNIEQPVTTVDGKLRFTIRGLEADIERFWAFVDAHTSNLRDTLVLDRGVVNPMQVVIDYVLYHDAVLVRVDVSKLVKPTALLSLTNLVVAPGGSVVLYNFVMPTVSISLMTTIAMLEATDSIPNYAYIEFVNVNDIESSVPPDVSSQLATYYPFLRYEPNRDILRVPISIVNDGIQTITTTFTTGGLRFGLYGNECGGDRLSRIVGVALVRVVDVDDPSRDTVLARSYFNGRSQPIRSDNMEVQFTVLLKFLAVSPPGPLFVNPRRRGRK